MRKKMTAEEADLRKKLGIPVGANVTFIDMGPGKPPRKTYGWTDEQVKNKTIEELDKMLESSKKVADKLRSALKEEEERFAGFTMIKLRNIELNNGA